MTVDGSRIVFSTGRTECGYGCVFGIDPDLKIYAGYDNSLYWDDPEDEDSASPAELMEFADHMIARWAAFKERQAARLEKEPAER